MNRNDWVFVGMRLFGLYLFVQGILVLPESLYALSMQARLAGSAPALSEGIALQPYGLALAGLRALVGLCLFLGTPQLAAWLERKDAAAAPQDGSADRSAS